MRLQDPGLIREVGDTARPVCCGRAGRRAVRRVPYGCVPSRTDSELRAGTTDGWCLLAGLVGELTADVGATSRSDWRRYSRDDARRVAVARLEHGGQVDCGAIGE